jgi:hypothetical protein
LALQVAPASQIIENSRILGGYAVRFWTAADSDTGALIFFSFFLMNPLFGPRWGQKMEIFRGCVYALLDLWCATIPLNGSFVVPREVKGRCRHVIPWTAYAHSARHVLNQRAAQDRALARLSVSCIGGRCIKHLFHFSCSR